MNFAGQVARMELVRISYKLLVPNFSSKRHLEILC